MEVKTAQERKSDGNNRKESEMADNLKLERQMNEAENKLRRSQQLSLSKVSVVYVMSHVTWSLPKTAQSLFVFLCRPLIKTHLKIATPKSLACQARSPFPLLSQRPTFAIFFL